VSLKGEAVEGGQVGVGGEFHLRIPAITGRQSTSTR
jgi:hypothetical protein